MNRIPQHTGYAEHSLVYILYANYCSVIVDANID